MSIPADLLRQAEEGGVPQARYTLTAPVGGVIAELGVREGVAVSPGMTLFRIAGLERVWAVAEVPEAQAVRLTRGQKVTAVLQADASQTFTGTMQEILPQVSADHPHAAGPVRGRQQGRSAGARACCCACRSQARWRPGSSCLPRL
jgi:Cu(I)/Ag(I) efflux system membrane fusion protein